MMCKQTGLRIFFIGFMGAGKTYWAEQIAVYLGSPFYDLDACIMAREKKSITRIFECEEESGFRKKEHNMLLSFEKIPDFVMSCGGGTPCFYDNLHFMNRIGNTVFLDISEKTLYDRLIRERKQRPLLKDKNNFEIKDFITRKLAERMPFYKQCTYQIAEENISLSSLLYLIQSFSLWKND